MNPALKALWFIESHLAGRQWRTRDLDTGRPIGQRWAALRHHLR